MTPDPEYAMGMAQVLATLAVAVAVVARRTSTRPVQSFQTFLHFLLGTFGLTVLIWDVLVASDMSPKFLSDWLRLLNFIATGLLLLLIYTLTPFFQTKAEQGIEAEARQIVRDRGDPEVGPSRGANQPNTQAPPSKPRKDVPGEGATQARRRPGKSNRKNPRTQS
jgi:hypothetical protein